MTEAVSFSGEAPTATAWLAEGLGDWLARWCAEQGGSADDAEIARHAGQALSLATREGHVCLSLADIAAAAEPVISPQALRAALLRSGVVGTPAAPGAMPLVLDDDGRLYLHRYFDHERRLAKRLATSAQATPTLPGPEVAKRLQGLFKANAAVLHGEADWQQLAAALALRGKLAVVSGGPGTGKTTMVVNLLACLLTMQPGCRIALAAPTGKAAARMTDALRQRAAHLPAALREQLPTSAATIHRLLGVTREGFAHDARHPLPIDALVVDEASMLDLALATRLLEAVPPQARIVLLGDKDQLAAVESGAVFAELSADPTLSDGALADLAALSGTPPMLIAPPAPARPSALHDSAVWFTQNFRFAADSGIGLLAREINTGQSAAVVRRLRAAQGRGAAGEPDDGVTWLEDEGALPSPATLAAAQAGFAPLLQAVAVAPDDVAAATAAYERFRVLCAQREGPRGLVELNRQLTAHARAAAGGPAQPGPWYAGRPVMVLRNDPLLRLFNGDVGLALPAADGTLLVWFAEAAAEGGFRPVAPVRLPPHETAYAMTVHKSQGSEFDEVLVVLPARPGRLTSRELLYTAVTRARRRVALSGPEATLTAAIQSPTQRDSGLLARLAEALGKQA
ncbi:exodeoxyribonuclease V subunit alpha [Aquincola sp. J276]|uniref:exodeoxyribonuclease V subunit alpha n=1 Tax=Aquincola sp. J276 TaxID=2898432 RepID=UPI002151F4A5|nr:exodeoxyribonuclease V subunit alpha [Aquincola sp. J276]MCR5867195.1 exodeoxyribonuclease V subunit alpha [Aquincola sp. J276]